MLKYLLVLSLLMSPNLNNPHPLDNMPLVNTQSPVFTQTDPLDNMPLVPSDLHFGSTPIAKRDTKYTYYLKSSVSVVYEESEKRIIKGSATICYYDTIKKVAYLISCGHLFPGNKNPNQTQEKCFIDVFYKNNKKLDKPQRFPAEVICFNNDEDISFLKFKPDWDIDEYFPIAPIDYGIKVGDTYESTGCDAGSEVASYTVEIESIGGRNLTSIRNSPRPGRSGGGLLSHNGYYLGIVWGTSNYDGSGAGFYVPLQRIHNYAKKFPETNFLLNITNSSILEEIPIIGCDRKFHKNFIPKG